MPQNPPAGMPRITPYLYYSDVARALEWLTAAFGFEERLRLPGEDGTGVGHAEMAFADGVLMLGPASADRGAASAQSLLGVPSSLYVYVDDVDAHCERARRAGAKIAMEPVDMFWGDRMYAAVDFDGQHWTFAEHVRDVPPEELQAAQG